MNPGRYVATDSGEISDLDFGSAAAALSAEFEVLSSAAIGLTSAVSEVLTLASFGQETSP